MKGGITSLLFAFKALRATDSPAWREASLAWFLIELWTERFRR